MSEGWQHSNDSLQLDGSYHYRIVYKTIENLEPTSVRKLLERLSVIHQTYTSPDSAEYDHDAVSCYCTLSEIWIWLLCHLKNFALHQRAALRSGF